MEQKAQTPEELRRQLRALRRLRDELENVFPLIHGSELLLPTPTSPQQDDEEIARLQRLQNERVARHDRSLKQKKLDMVASGYPVPDHWLAAKGFSVDTGPGEAWLSVSANAGGRDECEAVVCEIEAAELRVAGHIGLAAKDDVPVLPDPALRRTGLTSTDKLPLGKEELRRQLRALKGLRQQVESTPYFDRLIKQWPYLLGKFYMGQRTVLDDFLATEIAISPEEAPDGGDPNDQVYFVKTRLLEGVQRYDRHLRSAKARLIATGYDVPPRWIAVWRYRLQSEAEFDWGDYGGDELFSTYFPGSWELNHQEARAVADEMRCAEVELMGRIKKAEARERSGQSKGESRERQADSSGGAAPNGKARPAGEPAVDGQAGRQAPAPATASAGAPAGAMPAAGTKEQPWADDAPEYMLLSDVIARLADNMIPLKKLSNVVKKDGPMRYMRKGRRCKVHVGDFRDWWARREKGPDEAEALLEDMEKRKAVERSRRDQQGK